MKFTVVSHTNVPSPDLARAGRMDTMIVYTLADGSSDAVVIAGTSPSANDVIAAVRANEERKGKLVGQQLEA